MNEPIPNGGMFSGPRVEKFTNGWALGVFLSTAHYYQRYEAGAVRSICGRSIAMAGRLLHPGSWKRCKVCSARMKNHTDD